MISTPRLHLIPATPAHLRAELEGRAAFEAAIGFAVPENWPPDLYDREATQYILGLLEQLPEPSPWWLYYVVLRVEEGDVVVGTVGYKGDPDAEGIVEIGYGTLSQYRRRGIASEAARALVDRAFRDPAVKYVAAETFPDLIPSLGVMAKCGFRYMGPAAEQGVIRYGISRDEYAAFSASNN
ncbi:MAG TPA: GNAT family N-acetyltransferase [Rhodothermales bacterium]